jgi:hypothetical protein
MAGTSGSRTGVYPFRMVWQKEDAMVADWMLIYAVLFILGAAVVGRVPAA